MIAEPPRKDPSKALRFRALRRTLWRPTGLSARLLILTAFFVMVAAMLVIAPSLAAYEEGWLSDRVLRAEVASVAAEASPAGVVSERITGELLKGAGVVSVSVQRDGVRSLLLAPPRLPRAPSLIDLRRRGAAEWLAAPFEALTPAPPRMLRVIAAPQFRGGDFVEVVVPEAPLRADLRAYLARLLATAAFTSAFAGLLVYLSLNAFLVRPMQRITRAMERFRAHPQDPAARLPLSHRRDEIGRAETELARMQEDLLSALQSQARLAALGEAVAKINHDLRNMLTSAQLASERLAGHLAGSGDPRVAQALPRLERALDRAQKLAEGVLAYGSSAEAEPLAADMPLALAVHAAAEDAGLTSEGVRLELSAPDGLTVHADPEQFHRLLVNLLRNARQAIEAQATGEDGPRTHGLIRVSAVRREGAVVLDIADDGPGVPERARARLFQPFGGSSHAGGAGLGLAIARELARGHGGDLTLERSDDHGAVFRLTLPDAAAPH